MKCANCGSNRFKSGKCEYCGGLPIVGVCKTCMNPIKPGDEFCSQCGKKPEFGTNPPSGPDCPDCSLKTTRHDYGPITSYRCEKCQGIWLPTEEWNRLLKVAAEHPNKNAGVKAKESCDHAYRKCPKCNELMARKTPGKHMPTVDICPGHGVWLDVEELEAAIQATQKNAADNPIQPPEKRELNPELQQLMLTQRLRKDAGNENYESPKTGIFESILQILSPNPWK